MAELHEQDTLDDPIAQFRRWYAEAETAGVHDPDAMVVATADGRGDPSARVVLLRGVDGHGFRFYTNFDSAKGHDLAERPRAALVFHWREQGRQVRVTGDVTRLDDRESLEYWRNRPRASRLSAWASRQSARDRIAVTNQRCLAFSGRGAPEPPRRPARRRARFPTGGPR